MKNNKLIIYSIIGTFIIFACLAPNLYYILISFVCRIIKKIKTSVFKIVYPKFLNSVMYGIPTIIVVENLTLGKKVRINDNVFIHAGGKVFVDDYSILSHGVTILSTGLDLKNWSDKENCLHEHINKPVKIGKNVWLCANTIVCPGVKIADHCVIAAGSVVCNDLERPNSLYGGVPAHFIKDLSY